MNLFILRHGIAEMLNPFDHSGDDERKLTDEGIDLMRQEGQGMKALGLEFDCIVSSTLLRAKQTADLVQESYPDLKNRFTSSNLRPSSPLKAITEELREKYSEYQNVLIVGHEPMLGCLIRRLIDADPKPCVDVRKGSLHQLQIKTLLDSDCAQLIKSWEPEELAQILS